MKSTHIRCAVFVVSAMLLTACGTAQQRRPVGNYSTRVPAHITVGVGQNRAIATYALQYLGMPYVYGGSSPQTGFDCSGLIQYSARQSMGYILPRTTEQQSNVGQAIDGGQLTAGDLIFFNTTGQRISHAGIYLGNGLFVHAPNSNGVVRVENLSSPYWQPRISAMRHL